MSLQGLPDFQQPIQEAGLTIFYPFEAQGSFTLLPDSLIVAERNAGQPDFSLELVRGKNTYGVLDFKLKPHYLFEQAFSLLRKRYANATVEGAKYVSGYLRLQPKFDLDSSTEMTKPIPLGWNGLGIGRFILRLEPSTVSLFKKALIGELLAIEAIAEMEVQGVAPRVPVKVRFNSATLLNALAGLGDNEHRVKCDDVLNYFLSRDYEQLPLEIVGNKDSINRQDFAEALLDRIRARFGTFIPSPKQPVAPHFLLSTFEQTGSGQFEWDLSEPMSVSRIVVFHLNPFDAAQAIVKAQGIAAIYHETTVPPLPLGNFSIAIIGNFYTYRPNVVAVGVTLRAAPCPPRRFQTVTKTVELIPPEDKTSVTLKLSTAEKLEYSYSTYIVLNTAKGIAQLNGPSIPCKEEQLYVNIDDLPVDFVPIEATTSLLEIATINGICRWLINELPDERDFELNLNQPSIALALPKGATKIAVDIEAQEMNGNHRLKLEPLTSNSVMLDLFSFPEYGSHKIDIECVFDAVKKTFAIELLPEGRPELRDEISVLFFTPNESKKEWTWFAESPFYSGYRFRLFHSQNQSVLPWSDIRSPIQSLKIDVVTGGVI